MKKSLPRKAKITCVIIGIVVCLGILCALVIPKVYREHKETIIQAEKVEELSTAAGTYSEETIVLPDTTKELAEQLAEKLQARLRTTEDGTYAVLYLPEGMTVADVYQDEAYKSYLEQMDLDYHVDVSAVDANNRPLVSARPSFVVTDDLYPQQNYLDYINLQDTWNVTKGAGVTVAVIDSGIDTDHPDFAGRISERSYDATNDKVVKDYGLEVIEDEDGHGTSVAGVIAAGMNDGIGITGIAPDVELIVIKCETDGNGQFLRGSDLVFGLAYAIECDADVVNMSFGTPENIFSRYTQLAVDSDIICVAAAGNDGSAMPSYPAADDNVIAVGALDMETWSLADYSNYGYNLVLAPGTAYTTAKNGSYQSATGTSISSPIVTAAVALYLSQNPYTEFGEVCELLKASSVDLGILGEDRQHAFGALDIHALVCEEKGTITYEMLTDEMKNQTQIFVKGHTIQYMPEPERENVVLDGWYTDIQCTDEVEYFETVYSSDVTLYAAWINEDDGTAYIYRNLDDGTVEIQSYVGRRRFLTVPAVIGGKTVTSIGEYAFENNTRLRSVTLPESITNISQGAFYGCSNLRAMEIPENVVSIGNQAFYGCVGMSQVSLMKNGALTTIGDEAFAMCGIRTIHLPAKLTYLGSGAFYGSTGMTSVTVEDGNTTYQILDGALYDMTGTVLLYYPAGLSGTYSINQTTTAIADYAFAYSRCSEVILNEGIISLGENAFANSYLRSVEIPASVAQMGSYCFSGTKLSAVAFRENSALANIPDYGFNCCYYLKTITIPSNITTIGDSAFSGTALTSVAFAKNGELFKIGALAFSGCSLENIELPASLTEISSNAFSYCSALKNVTWEHGSRLNSVGQRAFEYCTSLKQIVLPDSLTQVDYCAFYGSGLESLTIGANLVNLGDGAFSGCKNLQNINVSGENPNYASVDGIVFSTDKTVLYMFPAGRSGSYTLPATTIRIADYGFAEAEKLTNVIFNEGLTEICGYAFTSCVSLNTPSLPASLTTIGDNAFEYCNSFNGTLNIPKNVISIGHFAFYDDYGLTSIVIEPESQLSRIGYGTFGYCGITDFTVPRSVSSMSQDVFEGCKNLIAVTFEADSQLEAIAAWTFSGANELRQITFEEGSALKLLEARSLEGLPKLERITLEYCTQLTTIDNYAFQNCTALVEISLPESLEEIGRYAFNGCKSLSRVDLPESIVFIGRYAFNHTNNLNVYFRSGVLPVHLEENWDYGINGYYVSTAEVVISGDWQYALTGDGKASIVAYTGTASHIDLTTMDGHEIVSIGGYAFADNTTLQTVTLPATLQGVYQYAFKGTTALQSISIPASVAVIDSGAFQGSGLTSISFAKDSALVALGQYAFADTKNLKSITLPAGVTAIQDYTFQNSGLEEISFAENAVLTEIGRFAFAASALKQIAIPANVTRIDYDAFHSCGNLASVDMSQTAALQIFANAFYGSSLTEVVIPAGVEYIGEFCFTASPNLTKITVDTGNAYYADVNGVLYNKDLTKLITCPAGLTGSYTVPNTVMTLGFAAFEGSRLSEVVFPTDSQLVTLGYRVFYNCDNLKSVVVPDGVQSIDNYAFAECNNLETVTFGERSQLSGIYKGAFYNNTSLTAITIPDGVQEIGEYAFYGCDALTELQFSENSQIKGIYDSAFAYSGVTEFVMPESLLEVGNSAFQGAKLATLVCNDAVIAIGDYAFADCGLANTTVLEFPETVGNMGYGVLKGASALRDLTAPIDKLNDLFGVLEPHLALDRLQILNRTTISNGALAHWHIGTVILPDSVTAIETAAFFDGTFDNVILPDGLLTIGTWAFQYAQIGTIDLPDSVTTIGISAFQESTLYCNGLPNDLEYIGEAAFAVTRINNVKISKKVREIGDGAFSGCPDLQWIDVAEDNPYYASKDGILYTKDYSELLSAPGGIQGKVSVLEGTVKIADNAFYRCYNVSDVYLPETVQWLGQNAFAMCGMKTINLPATVEFIGQACFYNCGMLSGEINIQNRDVKIEGSTFFGCGNLEKVTLPDGICDIPYYFLLGCSSITEFEIPDTVISIGYMAFDGCSGLEELNIPASVEEIQEGALSKCTALRAIHVAPESRYYSSVDGILYDAEKTQIISVPGAISGHVSIPDGVTVIGEKAFDGCANLESVVLPDSVERIEDAAFGGCERLSDIRIGNGIKTIGRQVFFGTAYLNNPDNWEDGVLYIRDCAVEYNPYCEELSFKNGTRVIAAGFDGNISKSIWMPDTVEYLSGIAFQGVDAKTIRISKNLKRIGSDCFSHCSNLYSINLPDAIQEGPYAFGYLPNLKYLKGGNVENSYMRTTGSISILAEKLESLYIPFTDNIVIRSCAPKNLIISTTDGMDTFFLSEMPQTTRVFCYVDDSIGWPSGWNHGLTTYYKDEWHLATFYANDIIVTMNPLLLGDVVQIPAENLVAELLPAGTELMGWDINGDGVADEIPVTLIEDLEAHAIVKIPVSEITLSETEATMEVTDEKELSVSYTPSNYNTSGELTWTSSNEEIATVDETGKVTAVSEGEVTITATLNENPEITASCTITVVPLQPGIRLKETEGALNAGESLTLEPRYVLLEEVMDTLAFTSSDETIVTVDAIGKITAVAPGTAEITISCGDYTAVYTVTVLLPAEEIAIVGGSASMNVKETMELDVQFKPENTTDDREITWKSSNTKLATVSRSGVVTAVAPGTVTITATTKTGLHAEYEITIYAPIEWIKLNTTVGTLRLDRTKQMEVIYEPSNTTDDKTVTWTSSDPEIATVSETGLVTGLKRGTAVITGKVGEHEATYTVTVIGLRDESTGITITNSDDTAMDEDVNIDVEHMDHDHVKKNHFSIWELIMEIFGENFGNKFAWQVYDISLSEHGEHVQPDRRVDVEIPFHEDMDRDRFKIYRVEEDGTMTDMTAEMWGKHACFQTDHFSMYVIGAKIPECETHTFGDWTAIEETSCAKPHKQIRQCQVCGVEEEEIIQPAEHGLTYHPAKPASCTEEGNIAHYACVCGKLYSDAEATNPITQITVDMLGHSWQEATCTTAKTCSVCGATEGDPLGHDWDDADCVTPKTCKVCGETEGEALGHDWADADCDTPKTCKVCGKTEGEALGHDWDDADCDTPKTCSVCGETEGEALGHSYDDMVTVPTCTAQGYTTHICSVCGDTYVDSYVNASGHVWQEARCMDPKMCIICWITEGMPLGHDLTNCIITREAKCTVDGEIQKYCGRCPYNETEVIPATGHSYTSVVAKPTCTEQGYTTHTCTNCGDSFVDSLVTALGHDYNTLWSWGNNDGHWHDCKNCSAHDDPVPHVPNPETNLKTCIDCGTLLLHTHSLTWIPAKEHTCTENGNIEYYTCTCGIWYADAEGITEITDKNSVIIVASGHNWKDATCTAAKTCETCGESVGNPLGHNWHVSPEMNTKTCIVCGVIEGVHITHTLSPWQVITEPTCTRTGLQQRICTVCNDYIESETIPAKGHTEVTDKAVAATCTAAGKTEGKHCTVCGAVTKTQQTVPAKGHTEVIDKAVAATCTTAGKTEGKHCSVCNTVLVAQQTVPAKGHAEAIDKAVAATCTTDGKTEGKHCSVCSAVLVAQQTVPAKGHTEVTDKAVAATCTTAGKTEGKHCSICGTVTIAQQTVPAKGHTEVVDKAVAATCTTAGKTEGKHCSVCNTVLVAHQSIPAKGHTAVPDAAVAATCTTSGKTSGSHCKTCGTVIMAQVEIPATGHNWKNATCTAPKTCKTCGATSGNAKGHDWAAGNCTTPKTCKVCGTTSGGVVHAYEHQYDYKCDACGTTRTVDMTRPMVDMFRMYNPNTGEHFYTGSTVERDNLVAVGWQYEGVGFTFPLTTGKPVHRLFQPSTGEHLYTMDEEEKAKLMAEGWNYEGIAFNSGFENEVPQFRLHNPNATVGAYHFTASTIERDTLLAAGWEYQGIGWYSLGA